MKFMLADYVYILVQQAFYAVTKAESGWLSGSMGTFTVELFYS